MCCRTNVYPLDKTIACSVLRVGHFTPNYSAPNDLEHPISWVRFIPEESSSVSASLSDEGLCLSISPSISTFSQHQHKRIASSVCFEIAAKYAEKVGGEVIQRGTVAGCREIGEPGDLVIARYPSQPLMWENVCRGFRAVLLGEDTP